MYRWWTAKMPRRFNSSVLVKMRRIFHWLTHRCLESTGLHSGLRFCFVLSKCLRWDVGNVKPSLPPPRPHYVQAAIEAPEKEDIEEPFGTQASQSLQIGLGPPLVPRLPLCFHDTLHCLGSLTHGSPAHCRPGHILAENNNYFLPYASSSACSVALSY